MGRRKLQLTEIVPDECGQEQRRQGNEPRRPRSPCGSPTQFPIAPAYMPRGSPTRTSRSESRAGQRTGSHPVQGYERQPDRREIIHLPDRRPLLGIGRDRTDGSIMPSPCVNDQNHRIDNKPGPTTSRFGVLDIGGSPGHSRPRSTRRSASRHHQPAQPAKGVTSNSSAASVGRRIGSQSVVFRSGRG